MSLLNLALKLSGLSARPECEPSQTGKHCMMLISLKKCSQNTVPFPPNTANGQEGRYVTFYTNTTKAVFSTKLINI